jgi:hypothetical protein
MNAAVSGCMDTSSERVAAGFADAAADGSDRGWTLVAGPSEH